jgi:hypothetical protein
MPQGHAGLADQCAIEAVRPDQQLDQVRIRVSRGQTDRCGRSPLIKKGVWRDFGTPRSQQPLGSFITSGKNLSLTGIIRLALRHFLAVLCPFSRLDKSKRSLSSPPGAGLLAEGAQFNLRTGYV